MADHAGENAASGVETEFLIIGCGPAGASLACFLASYGLKGVLISCASGTADTPRAHITNMAAMECLRDIGLEEEVMKVATKAECMAHTRWCHSMAGEEYARVHSWGNGPDRTGDYEKASPCEVVDLPQTLLEPILIRYATHHGFKVRFDTAFLNFVQSGDGESITANVRDDLSGLEYQVRTKYLFGADGAQSQVMKQLDLPLDRKPGQGIAINVLVKVDLSHLMTNRAGNLHWVIQPDREYSPFAWMGVVRMVKPWDEWMFIMIPDKDWDCAVKPSDEEYLSRVQDFIGDDTPAEIVNVSRWYVNEIVAEEYSRGNIFCLGDAVHRHPPMNGLGSNTCIQDAYNLAWKIAYVHRGAADPSLLSTYSIERQPVGHTIVTRANQSWRDHFPILEALGMSPKDVAERKEILDELGDAGEKGQNRRKLLRESIVHTTHEFNSLGIEMGQRYSGLGVYDADETVPFAVTGAAAEDTVLSHQPNTYPGSRLPHIWLNKSIPSTPVSTIDLAGNRHFTLFTGIGGSAWKTAAQAVASELSIDVEAWTIGFRQDWEDVYYDWEKLRGVEESGAVLVRPDRFVAWRAQSVLGAEAACVRKLSMVMKSILGFGGGGDYDCETNM